jgi:hypothetical protein
MTTPDYLEPLVDSGHGNSFDKRRCGQRGTRESYVDFFDGKEFLKNHSILLETTSWSLQHPETFLSNLCFWILRLFICDSLLFGCDLLGKHYTMLCYPCQYVVNEGVEKLFSYPLYWPILL